MLSSSLWACYQVVFGHYLGPRIIFIGAEFVEIVTRYVTWDFGSKFEIFKIRKF